MNFYAYQVQAMRTDDPSLTTEERIKAAALGIAGEAGEVVDLIKKRFYHPHVTVSTHDIAEEMGDLLWYLAWMADALGMNFNTVAVNNIKKLEERYPDGFPTQTDTFKTSGE